MKRSRAASLAGLAFVLILAFLLSGALPAAAQDLQSLAKQRIAQETGLDEDLLATIFVSEDNAQFILTFIYITDRTFDSQLKPELKQAIAPYKNRNAMLVLVTPAIDSYFNPLAISFVQNRVSYRVRFSSIRRIDEAFTVGTVPSGQVTAGIILLDQLEPSGLLNPAKLNPEQPFTITYLGHYSTEFALQSPGGTGVSLGLNTGGSEGGAGTDLLQLLWLNLLNLLLLLLLSFLLYG